MGTIEAENYNIKIRFARQNYSDDEPSLEKVSLTFKENSSQLNIGWLNKATFNQPTFIYNEISDGVTGHAKEMVGYKGFVDKNYKSEFWDETGARNATSRSTLESGKLLEVQYSVSSNEEGKLHKHFYSERTYITTEDGHGLKTYYNINDIKNGQAISFTTDGKGHIDKESIKERKLSEFDIENLKILGENHYQEVKGFFEHNNKKNLEKNPTIDGNKTGFVDPEKFSEKVGALTDGLKLDNLVANKGIVSSELLNKKNEIS